MARTRQKNTRLSPRRERNHVLSVEVTSPRIIAHTILSKTRKIVIYGLVTLVLILLTWAIFRLCKHLFIQGERFQLTELKITPEPKANSFFTYTTLPELTGITLGESIFSYDLGKIESSLKAFSEVKEATVKRRLPGTIAVSIEEYTPIATITYKGEKFLIDPEGYCFKSKLAVSSIWNTLPNIIPLYKHDVPVDVKTKKLNDIGLNRALHLASKWKEHNNTERLLSISVKDYHSLESITQSGSKLIFGYYEHDRQIEDYQSLLTHAKKNSLAVMEVNLLPFKNIPVVFDHKPLPIKSQLRTNQIPHKSSPTTHQNADDDILLILEQG